MAIAIETGKEASSQGKWLPTACFGCFSMCGVLAYVEDGGVQDIKGNPESPNGRGKICAKGISKILSVSDPCRVHHLAPNESGERDRCGSSLAGDKLG